MILIRLSMLSHRLGLNATLHLLLPNRNPPREGYQVLYLLHGYMGDGSDWIRQSDIERYLEDTQTIAVMPDGGKAFYTDTATGDNYWSFLSQELPDFLARYFPISHRRQDTFAVGLSMGGYGAVKLGLRQPERFSYVGCFSGALDISWLRVQMQLRPDILPNCIVPPNFGAIFGTEEDFADSDDDVTALLNRVAPLHCPQLLFFCGNRDFLLPVSKKYAAEAEARGLPCGFEEFAGGHEWNFWNAALKKTLDRLPLRREFPALSESN